MMKVNVEPMALTRFEPGTGTGTGTAIFAGYWWHCWNCRRGGAIYREVTDREIAAFDGVLDCPNASCEKIHRRRSS